VSSQALQDPGLLDHINPPAARRLAAAGLECFAEKGFHATTTRDIATRAKLSPAAVYVHYKSKGDLLYSISRVGHEAALSALEEAAGDESDPARRIELLVIAFAGWHARNHRLARVVQYELDFLPGDRREEILEIRQRFGDLIEAELREGIKAGKLTVTDVSGATLAILSLCIDVARWFSESGPRTPDEIGELYGGLMLKMLGASGS
jgi:AcrR family transcriptional regulator